MRVRLEAVYSDAKFETDLDHNGEFRFSGLQPGRYIASLVEREKVKSKLELDVSEFQTPAIRFD